MSTFDAQINESQKQVAEAQSKISELTSRIETARQKMAAGTDISVDIENASLEDVHAHTELMNANIAGMIWGPIMVLSVANLPRVGLGKYGDIIDGIIIGPNYLGWWPDTGRRR